MAPAALPYITAAAAATGAGASIAQGARARRDAKSAQRENDRTAILNNIMSLVAGNGPSGLAQHQALPQVDFGGALLGLSSAASNLESTVSTNDYKQKYLDILKQRADNDTPQPNTKTGGLGNFGSLGGATYEPITSGGPSGGLLAPPKVSAGQPSADNITDATTEDMRALHGKEAVGANRRPSLRLDEYDLPEISAMANDPSHPRHDEAVAYMKEWKKLTGTTPQTSSKYGAFTLIPK